MNDFLLVESFGNSPHSHAIIKGHAVVDVLGFIELISEKHSTIAPHSLVTVGGNLLMSAGLSHACFVHPTATIQGPTSGIVFKTN